MGPTSRYLRTRTTLAAAPRKDKQPTTTGGGWKEVSKRFSLLGRPSMRTNRVGRGLSLNRSQCGGCSTKYDTPSLKSSGLRAIPRLTLHGGFETRRRRQNPACRGGQVGWPFRARRRGCNADSTDRKEANPQPASTADATGDDDRYGRLQRNEKRRLSKYRGGTGRGSGLEAFSRYRAEAAWHRRSFERAREPLLRSRGSSRTGRDSRGHGRRNKRVDR